MVSVIVFVILSGGKGESNKVHFDVHRLLLVELVESLNVPAKLSQHFHLYAPFDRFFLKELHRERNVMIWKQS